MIKASPYFNDPAMGAAAANLAALFAPPSGADAAGWATAKAKREEAARLAWLFENTGDPNFDRRAIAADLYDPSGSFYAVDQGNATLRANNASDNARALEAARIAEAGAMDRQRLQGLGSLFGTVTQDAIRPAIPAEVGAQFGLSGGLPAVEGLRSPMSETQAKGAFMLDLTPEEQRAIGLSQGAIKVAPGERAILPDRSVIEGAAKPLSETEWQAQQNERLRQSGQLSDQLLIDSIMGDQAPVEAIGAGGRPVFMSRGAAIRTGAQPAPSSPAVQVNMGEAPDGKLRGKLDEAEGKRLSDLQAAAVTSAGFQQDLDLLSQLIEQAPQGPIVGRLASALPGFSSAGAAFQSIVERAAPGLRVEGSGATSDIEFQGMLKSLPSLRNRPEANRLIVDMMRAKAAVNVERGEVISAYQNNEISAGQMRQLLAELNKRSIMSPGLRSMIGAVGGGEPDQPLPAPTVSPSTPEIAPGAVLDGYRFRGGDPAIPSNWEPVE